MLMEPHYPFPAGNCSESTMPRETLQPMTSAGALSIPRLGRPTNSQADSIRGVGVEEYKFRSHMELRLD